MLILLPERIDGMESLEEQLTAENLEKWRSEMTKSRLFLQIPKFTLETDYNLVKDLMALGIKDAFGPADFSGISSESLFIDRAVHKAFVDVNEKGTEAAAATGISMRESMPPTFRADHPFVFVIMDNETGNILFLGKVVDPSQ
jgi:serpin B